LGYSFIVVQAISSKQNISIIC